MQAMSSSGVKRLRMLPGTILVKSVTRVREEPDLVGNPHSFSVTCLAHHYLPRPKCLMEGLCLVRPFLPRSFTALEVDGLRAEAFCSP
jgi:hypothetical protein